MEFRGRSLFLCHFFQWNFLIGRLVGQQIQLDFVRNQLIRTAPGLPGNRNDQLND